MKTCSFCGARLGMVSYRLGRLRFHSKRCKRLWREYHQYQGRVLDWLRWLKLVPP